MRVWIFLLSFFLVAYSSERSPEDWTLAEVLEYTLEAKGGREAVNQMQSLRQEGYMLENGERTLFFSVTYDRKGKSRIDRYNEDGAIILSSGFDGEVSWNTNYNEFTPRIISRPSFLAYERVRARSPFISPFDFEDFGVPITLMGTVKLNGMKHWKLEALIPAEDVTVDSGDVYELSHFRQHYFVNKETGHITRIYSVFLNGTRETVDFLEYSSVSGVNFPHSAAIDLYYKSTDALESLTFEYEYEVNPNVPLDYYDVPTEEKNTVEP